HAAFHLTLRMIHGFCPSAGRLRLLATAAQHFRQVRAHLSSTTSRTGFCVLNAHKPTCFFCRYQTVLQKRQHHQDRVRQLRDCPGQAEVEDAEGECLPCPERVAGGDGGRRVGGPDREG